MDFDDIHEDRYEILVPVSGDTLRIEGGRGVRMPLLYVRKVGFDNWAIFRVESV